MFNTCDAAESFDIDGLETHDVVCVAPPGHAGPHTWRESWIVENERRAALREAVGSIQAFHAAARAHIASLPGRC